MSARIAAVGDLWGDLYAHGQSLEEAMVTVRRLSVGDGQ
jgi:hypothetical protein